VSLRRTASETRDVARLRRTSRAVTELLKASDGAKWTQSPLRSLNMEVTYAATSDKARALLTKRTTDTLRTLLAGTHAAGTPAATDSPPSPDKKGP
jgi:hypothetical protein